MAAASAAASVLASSSRPWAVGAACGDKNCGLKRSNDLLLNMGLEFEPRTFSFKALVFVAKTKLQLPEGYRTWHGEAVALLCAARSCLVGVSRGS